MNLSQLFGATASVLVSALAQGAEPQILYGTWGATGELTWKASPSGESVDWQDGSEAYITSTINGSNNNPTEDMSVYKMVFDVDFAPKFWIEHAGGKINLGEGGLEFVRPGVFSVGYRDASSAASRIHLMADQTWKGPSSGETYAEAVVGAPAYWNASYAQMPLAVDTAVQGWTIDGMLKVWLCSSHNDLSGLTVTVREPAKLLIAEDLWLANNTGVRVQQSPATLKAKKLVLSGEGDGMLPIGVAFNNVNPGYALEDHPVGMITRLGTNLAQSLELHDGADLTASVTASVSIPELMISGAGESIMRGSFVFENPEVKVVMTDGATLILDGNFSETTPGTSFTVTGTGCFGVTPKSQWDLTGELNLGENVKWLVLGSGRFERTISGSNGIEVAGDENDFTYLPSSALCGWTGDSIHVRKGTLLLEDELEGVTVVTEPGAQVVYSDDYDYIITDKIRTESEISLPAGSTLHVYGNGLTAATKLVLNGGAGIAASRIYPSIVFHASATVGASVVVPAGASPNYAYVGISAPDERTVGTLAGFVEVKDWAFLYAFGPGTTVCGGGGKLCEYSRLMAVDDATLVVSGGEFTSYWHAIFGVGSDDAAKTFGKSFVVRDGGSVLVATSILMLSPYNDDGVFKNSASLVIGENGTVEIRPDSSIELGTVNNCATVELSGGRLLLKGRMYDYGVNVTATIQLNSGLLELGCPLKLNKDSSRYIVNWRGGTIKPLSTFEGEALFTGGLKADGETRNIEVGILGDGCCMDLSDLPQAAFTNMPPTANRGEWFGTGTLTVKGGKDLLMRSMPNAMKLRIEGDGSRVLVDDDTRFFNAEKCAPYAVWRRPTSGYSWQNYSVPDYYNTKELGLEEDGFDVAELKLADGAGVLENKTPARTVSVAAVTVERTGVWDNAKSIVSALSSVGDLTFAKDSIWRVTPDGASTKTLTLGGALTLGEELGIAKVRNGRPVPSTPLIIGTDSVIGNPIWSQVPGFGKARPEIMSDGKGLGLFLDGMNIILR